MSEPLEVMRRALADRYRVEAVIGQGGMSTVYRATDLKHGRAVALKVLGPELSAAVGEARFRREIDIAAALQHPHIVPLLDSGQADGSWFYVMPFVAGESLRARLDRERQLAVPEALRLAAHVAGALAYAHRQGVIHRDIKPENILLADGRAMIADFGVARRVGASTDRITTTGVTLGSTLYMSPEQVAADPTIDGRSDVYSLGCVLYEMLAGQPPFSGVTFESIAHQHLNVAPRRVSEMRPTVPAEVDAVVARALAKLAADRFTRAEDMEAALEGAATQERSPMGVRTATTERTATGGGGFRDAESFDVAPTRPRSPDEPSRRRETLHPPSPSAAGTTPGAEKRGIPRAFVAAALTALAVLALTLSWRAGWLGGGAKPGAPRWVLLADFEGGGDPELTGAAHDLVASLLDRSPTLATVQPDQIALALRSAGRPDTARLDPALAREIAYRAAIPTVVEGSIRRTGAGYASVLRAVASRDGRVIASVSDASPDERGLMRSLERLTGALRARIGGRAKAEESGAPAVMAITPSFDAFKIFARARHLIDDNQPIEAVKAFRQALALDRDFAAAYAGMGTAFSNIGMPDSAAAAYDEALRRPDRLTDFQRIDVEAKRLDLSGDSPAVIAAYQRALRLELNPRDAFVGHQNLGAQLQNEGYDAQSIEEFRRAASMQPIGAMGITEWSIAVSEMRLGRFDDARRTLGRMTHDQSGNLDILLATSMRDWRLADSLAQARRLDPREPSGRRIMAGIAYAGARAVNGAIADARRALDQAVEIPGESAEVPRAYAQTLRAWLAAQTGRPEPAMPADLRPTKLGEVLAVISAARRGDAEAIRQRLPRLSDADSVQSRTRARFARGLLSARHARWAEAIADLAPLAGHAARARDALGLELIREARWVTADAYEELQQPDSAVVYLDLIATTGSSTVLHSRGIHHAFALRRLVMLETRLGRLDDAQRHWEELSAVFTQPDPEFVPWLDEARMAYVTARGMKASGTR